MKGTANITVRIIDEDDNCPVFDRDNYYAILEENAPFGTYVITVHATDRDTGRYAELDYGILEGNDRGLFFPSQAPTYICSKINRCRYRIISFLIPAFQFCVCYSHTGAFRVDEISGNVTVSGEVNKELESQYYIKIRAGAKNCGVKTNDSNTGK